MRNSLFLILALTGRISAAQDFFTGEITYSLEILPLDSLDFEAAAEAKIGSKSVYIIGDNHYKSSYYIDKEYNYSYTYHNETKYLYDDTKAKPYVTFRDSRIPVNEYPGGKIYKDSLVTLLGHDCFAVVTKTDFGKSTRFYANELKIDYKAFEGHKLGNWYNKLQEVEGRLPLKIINEYDTYTEIQEAVKVKRRNVRGKEFNLPKNKPVIASYTSLTKQAQLKKPTDDQINCYKNKVEMKKALTASNAPYISYLSFMLTKEGEIKFIRPVEHDNDGYFEIAVDILEQCGIQFDPGEINGKPVDSEVFFPVKFN